MKRILYFASCDNLYFRKRKAEEEADEAEKNKIQTEWNKNFEVCVVPNIILFSVLLQWNFIRSSIFFQIPISICMTFDSHLRHVLYFYFSELRTFRNLK